MIVQEVVCGEVTDSAYFEVNRSGRVDLHPPFMAPHLVFLRLTTLTYTPLPQGDPESKRRFPLINLLLKPAITSEGAAGAIVSAIKGGRRHYCYPFMLSAAAGLVSHMPLVVRWLTQIGSLASLKGKPYVG